MASKDSEYVTFVHRLKQYAKTPYHNHGESAGTVFILPITQGLSEQSFLHNITDFSINNPVSFFHAETHKLNQGKVYIGTNNLIHQVFNPTAEIQTFVEIYLPIPQNMKIYLPFYGEENKFLPVNPICTNVTYHQALAEPAKDNTVNCADLILHTDNTIFTSTGSVIQCPTVLERYIGIEGCDHAVQVDNDKFVLFTEEVGKATDVTENN